MSDNSSLDQRHVTDEHGDCIASCLACKKAVSAQREAQSSNPKHQYRDATGELVIPSESQSSSPKCISRGGCLDRDVCRQAGCCMRPSIPVPDETLDHSKTELPPLEQRAICPDGLGQCDQGCAVNCKKALERDGLIAPQSSNERSLIERLRTAQVASCSCLTKTPEVRFHELLCHYRLFSEAEQELRGEYDKRERLRQDIQELTCGDPRKVCPNCRDKTPDEAAQPSSNPKSHRELLESARGALRNAGLVTRNLVASWIDAALESPEVETVAPNSNKRIASTLRELAKLYADRHNRETIRELNEAADLIEPPAPETTTTREHRWVLPSPPVTASNYFCGDCGFFPGPEISVPAAVGQSDDQLRLLWRAAGGSFYGPTVEHGTMEERALFQFLRVLMTGSAAEKTTDGYSQEYADQMRTALCKIMTMQVASSMQRVAADALRPPLKTEVRRCSCGEILTGHEDESATKCRWCVTGWKPSGEPSNAANG